ncbi:MULTISPECIES: LysE family translocator [Streptomyces]|jgi:threonine/homoserine/homoserine lactone efflux protein|uniref:LysE family translocator n=1 Tax=Streptomyces doudnae TaxID=3075536 RepID=A0ABD5EYA0_9ACTN|nr:MULTISPECIES: LysE family translocator [unclassified Streptomyces]MDT0438367.1 LysE family translocator [Streptomyces sp. DSM 41981]MYQ65513.1 LysE family transporter [Streptomyces sp. SID4950]SCE01517.1 Threonine/homoserine/homoserine lactone efflux protein [Streptomyces sp. SolWspMP-5a-2]
MPTHVPVFIATTLLLAMLPGASAALMIRQVLEGGQRTLQGTLAGNATGFVLWSTAAAAGLSAVLLASPTAYTALRIAGGIVLMYLGVKTLRTTLNTTVSTAPADEGEHRTGFASGYITGLSTNLGNPKAGVFAISVLPQFVTAKGPVFLSTVALGVVWALVSASWYMLLTWAVSRGRDLVSKPTVLRGLSVTTGVVLLGLGAAVAAGV